MTELKQLRDFAEQVNGIRPQERSLKGVVNNLISNYKGGGGATYTAGNGIFISEDNDISILEFIENIEDISTNLSKSRVKHILDVDMGAFIPGAIKVDITDSESEDYYVYLYPNRKGYDDNDNDVFIWTSPVKNNKYYQMTLALENPLPNQTPITVEEISVGGAGGATLHPLKISSYGHWGTGGELEYLVELIVNVKDTNINSVSALQNYLINNGYASRYDSDLGHYVINGLSCVGLYKDETELAPTGITAFYEDGEYGISVIAYDNGFTVGGHWFFTEDDGMHYTFEYLDTE